MILTQPLPALEKEWLVLPDFEDLAKQASDFIHRVMPFPFGFLAPKGALTATGIAMTGVGSIASNVVITGVGFKPKAVVFFMVGHTAITNQAARQSTFVGIGFAVDATNRGTVFLQSPDASSTASSGGEWWRDDCCVGAMLNNSATQVIDGLLDFVSMDNDGFTLVVDDGFATSRSFMWWALGGSVSLAKFGKITGSSGSQAITGVGFQPKCVMTIDTYNASTSPNSNARGALGFGITAGAAASGSLGLGTGRSNNGSSVADKYLYTDAFYGMNWNGITQGNNGYFSLTSFDSDGFTINWGAAGNGSHRYMYLALGGPLCSFGLKSFQTQTDTVTPIVVSGLGFQPSGGFFISHMETESAAHTTSANGEWAVGAIDTRGNRNCVGHYSVDGATPNQVSLLQRNDAVLGTLTSAGAVDALMDIQSRDSGGMTFIMDDADGAQARVYGLFVG